MLITTRKGVPHTLSKRNPDKLPLYESILGYKIMGLTILTFIISLAVYFGFVYLGNYLSEKYDPGKSHIVIIQASSILLAFMCYFLILLAFLQSLASDIKHLSSDTKKITNGSLEHEIRLRRRDELGDLASDINIMQHSLIERMEAERKAIQSNRELITSLSHDLRTPLTKQMCAIELALKNNCGDNQEIRKSLLQIYKHSEQIKEISDELFSYFLAEDRQHEINFEIFDGQTLFIQLLSEYSDFLESSGFMVKLRIPQTESFTVSADVSCLTRIMDNLASNIRKYADNEHAVEIDMSLEPETVCVKFRNVVRADDGRLMESSNIGIHSAEKMAELLGGSLSVCLDDNIFTAVLTLKINTTD